TYMGMLVWPMIAMGSVVNLIQRGMASWERIAQLMSERPVSTGMSHGVTPVRGEIEFQGVQVCYPTGDDLSRVDLTRPWDSTLARPGPRSRRERASLHATSHGRCFVACRLAHPGRRDGRDRGPYRQRQEHAGEPDSAIARSHARLGFT